MEPEQSLRRWAQTTELPDPIRWGEVEAAVLARPVPPEEIENLPTPPRLPRAVLLPLAVLFYAAPLVGLAMVLVGVGRGDDTGLQLIRFAPIPFLAGAVAAGTAVAASADSGRRRAWDVPAAGATAILAGAGLLVLLTTPGSFGLVPWTLLAVVLASLVALSILVLRRRPRLRLPRVREDALTPTDRWYLGARAEVLDVLIERDAVQRDDLDVPGMREMPLGTWAQLDGR